MQMNKSVGDHRTPGVPARTLRRPVCLETVRPLGAGGSAGYEYQVRLPDGSLEEAVISADEAAALLGNNVAEATHDLPPAGAEKPHLPVESSRIRLACAYDRQFAVSLSGIRTLPHHIEAIYRKMLLQPRSRFLLVDDPGAGKTIMSAFSSRNSSSVRRSTVASSSRLPR